MNAFISVMQIEKTEMQDFIENFDHICKGRLRAKITKESQEMGSPVELAGRAVDLLGHDFNVLSPLVLVEKL